MIFTHLSIPAAAILASLSSCPEQQKISVDLVMEQNEPVYITTKSVKQLTKMHGLGHNLKTLGLTLGRTSYNNEAVFANKTRSPGGVTCITMRSYKMKITYTPKVYIASDFKKGECRYNIVLAHEKKHVAIDKELLQEYAPKILKRLREITSKTGPRGPFPRKLLDSEQARVLQSVSAQLKPLMDKLEASRASRQAELDTVSNYRREKALCPAK